jgi:hypothetical protein
MSKGWPIVGDGNRPPLYQTSEAPRQGLAGLASLHAQRKDLCLLKTSSIGGIFVISDPKAPGIITFS